MRFSAPGASKFAACLTLILALPASGSTAPTGTAAEILANVDVAIGLRAPGIVVEDWAVDAYGMTGSEHVVRAGGDIRITSTLGPFVEQEGRFRGQSWRQNDNGVTVLLTKRGGMRQSITSQTFLAALRERAHLRFAETIGSGPATDYVLEDDPAAGTHRRVVIDGRTWLPSKVDLELPGRRIVLEADAFERHDGVTLPAHIHARDSLSPSNDVDWRLTAYRGDAEDAPPQLAIPGSDRVLANFPRGVTRVDIPAHFVGAHVIVRVSVDGNPVDMLLDSGSSETALDHKLAAALGLHEYGRSVEIAAGRYARSRVFIHELKIGRLTLRNLAASSLPFDFKPRPGVRALGLVGFDLFADAVIHVDYEHQRVEAIAHRAFHPGSLGNATVLPVSIDDGVPLTPVRIDGADAHFVLDTGSPDAVVFDGFARAHGIGTAAGAVKETGVGGSLRLAPIQVSSLDFAGESFGEFGIQEALDATAFEASGADGIMGYQFMRLYDWYFDEAGGAVYATPNAAFTELKSRTHAP